MSRLLLVAAALAALSAPSAAQTAERSASGPDVPTRADVLPARAAGATRAGAARPTVTVTTAADSGPGSLRQAIEDSRQSPGPHIIQFNIDGGGSYREIFLQSPLLPLRETVTIDGDTQNCVRISGPCIRIDGGALPTGLPGVVSGLDVIADGSVIRNLVVTRFRSNPRSAGVFLAGTDQTVAGCHIGLNRAGLTADPDGVPNSGDELGNSVGVRSVPSLLTPGSPVVTVPLRPRIGGPDPADRNLIGGNLTWGVGIVADSAVVEGNDIGINSTGFTAVPNAIVGVLVGGARGLGLPPIGGARIERNVVSGNGSVGIEVSNESVGVQVVGNFVGTGPSGSIAISNGPPTPVGPPTRGNGIAIIRAEGTRVEGNVVSGNNGLGIQVGALSVSASDPGVTRGTVIANNLVGLKAVGTEALPNGTPGNDQTGVGILLLSAAALPTTGTVVGGTFADLNFVSGNTTAGIAMLGADVTGNVVSGNAIGFAADFETPVPNGGSTGIGIAFGEGAHGNRIGAADVASADSLNVVGPHAAPIGLQATAGVGNAVGFNQIVRPTASPLPAIEIGFDGPTANDPGDGDEGANRLQNAPVLSAASVAGDELTVTLVVDSAPANAAYPLTVHVYRRDAVPGAQAYTPVGLLVVPEAQAGQPVTAVLPLEPGEPAPTALAATATDAAGNTSELPLTAFVVADAPAAAALPGGRRLAAAGPNPLRERTAFRLEVAAPQAVRAELFDALGRRVAVLAEADAAPGTAVTLALDGRSLAPGAYTLRVAGDGWQEVRTVTVVR